MLRFQKLYRTLAVLLILGLALPQFQSYAGTLPPILAAAQPKSAPNLPPTAGLPAVARTRTPRTRAASGSTPGVKPATRR